MNCNYRNQKEEAVFEQIEIELLLTHFCYGIPHETVCLNLKMFTGNQPLGGRMTAHKTRNNLPGFGRSGTINITYDFDAGIQGPEHSNPGKPYGCYGFPRAAYLPDNPAGRKILL